MSQEYAPPNAEPSAVPTASGGPWASVGTSPTAPGGPVRPAKASRRDKVVAELARNREGGHRVPTWVLGTVLAAVVVGLAAFIVFGAP